MVLTAADRPPLCATPSASGGIEFAERTSAPPASKEPSSGVACVTQQGPTHARRSHAVFHVEYLDSGTGGVEQCAVLLTERIGPVALQRALRRKPDDVDLRRSVPGSQAALQLGAVRRQQR